MLRLATRYLADLISEEVIGQRKAVETILSAICENFEAYAQGKPMKLNNILLMGPTGSGKTQIARSITKILDIPFVRVTMADYTLTGYKGRDVQEIVTVDLYNAIKSRQQKKIKKMILRYEIATSVLEVFKEEEEPSLRFKVAAEFAALFVFLGTVRAERMIRKRYKDKKETKELIEKLKKVFRDIEEAYVSTILDTRVEPEENLEFDGFLQKPFGIIFIDEIDKILIKERDDDVSFYRPIQEFILTMIEGTKVTADKGTPVDTSHVTFILSGAFSEHSPDEFIPKLRGRLNVKVNINKLTYKDYLKIIKKEGINVSETFRNYLVKIDESSFEELAKACERLNEKEYTGARRIKEVLSKLNRALSREIQESSSFPIVVDKSFVKWAINFEAPEEPLNYWKDEESPETSSNKKLEKQLYSLLPSGKEKEEDRILSKKENSKLQDIQFKVLLNHYKDLLAKENYILDYHSSGHDFPPLFKTDSTGRTIIETLIDENYIQEISENTYNKLVNYIKKHEKTRKEKLINKLTELTELNDIVKEILDDDILF